MQAQVISIHVGKIREWSDGSAGAWRSAIAKEAVDSPVHVGPEGLEGDQFGNRNHHGGHQKAVLAYPSEHGPYWQQELGLAVGPGGFGENLSLCGLTEREACIGDVYALGDVLLQVSQPREPCHTLARRWECPALLDVVWRTGRGGWYLRVVREGLIQAGMPFDRVERPHPDWSVLRVMRALQGQDPEEQFLASRLAALSPKWQAKLARKSGAEPV